MTMPASINFSINLPTVKQQMTESIQNKAEEKTEASVKIPAATPIEKTDPTSQLLSSGAFLVYLLLLGTLAICMTKGDKHHAWALKIVLILAVIGSVVFVCLLNIPKEYITSIVGLLGTVAGFVLNNDSKPEK